MPFMSGQELAIVKSTIAAKDRAIERFKEKASANETGGKLAVMGAGLGSAGFVGFVRGKLEDKTTGQWNVPGTQLDIELLAVVGLAGIALAGDALGLKKYQGHAAAACAGVGGHYVGQVARKIASTGKFSLIAGANVGALPQYDPTSFDPTQMAAPYDDPVASALSRAGV